MKKTEAKKLKPAVIRGWVICTVSNSKLTEGKKYKVRGHFSYLNGYRSGGETYWTWDEFLTLKNDEGWTVKVSRYRFKPCPAPISDKDRIAKLEKEVNSLKTIIEDGRNLR